MNGRTAPQVRQVAELTGSRGLATTGPLLLGEVEMLGAFFFVTVVALLAGHYVLVERPRRLALEREQGPRALPLKDIIPRLPGGVFLQPTFTWSQLRSNGDVELGVHPLLYGLVGPGATVELQKAGDHIEKGETVLNIRLGERTLAVRSPIGGRIVATNPRASTDAGWRGVRKEGGNWVYVVEPTHIAEEVPGWMIADSARDWTRKQYGSIRDFMMMSGGDEHAQLHLADGGELPLGALEHVSPEDWSSFEEAFLSATG